MNDAILNQLKAIVERSVRPIRASTLRKWKMREELLAHVAAVFEEESAKLGDVRAAVEQTERRFGNPHELTRQLQESVPASDDIHCLLDKLWFQPGERNARRVLRYVTLHSLILMFLLPIWYVWTQICEWLVGVSNWPPEERPLFGGPVLLFDVFFFLLSFVVLLWGLVSVNHRMTARIRSNKEWSSLQID